MDLELKLPWLNLRRCPPCPRKWARTKKGLRRWRRSKGYRRAGALQRLGAEVQLAGGTFRRAFPGIREAWAEYQRNRYGLRAAAWSTKHNFDVKMVSHRPISEELMRQMMQDIRPRGIFYGDPKEYLR